MFSARVSSNNNSISAFLLDNSALSVHAAFSHKNVIYLIQRLNWNLGLFVFCSSADKESGGTIRGQLTGELGGQSEQSVVSQHGQPQAAQRRQLRLHQSDEAVWGKHVCAQILFVLVFVLSPDGFGGLRFRLLLDLHRHHVDLTKTAGECDRVSRRLTTRGRSLRFSPQPTPSARPVSPWWWRSRCTAGWRSPSRPAPCPARTPAGCGLVSGRSGRWRRHFRSTCYKPWEHQWVMCLALLIQA